MIGIGAIGFLLQLPGAPCLALIGDPTDTASLAPLLSETTASKLDCLQVHVSRSSDRSFQLLLQPPGGDVIERRASTATIAAALIESWATPASAPAQSLVTSALTPSPVFSISASGVMAGTLEIGFYGASARVGVYVGRALIFTEGQILESPAPNPNMFGALSGDDVEGLVGVGWTIAAESAHATPAIAIGVGHYDYSWTVDRWAYAAPPSAITSLRAEASLSAGYSLTGGLALEGRAALGLFPSAGYGASPDPPSIPTWIWAGPNVIAKVSLGLGFAL